MRQRIGVIGLRASGRHGANTDERRGDQEFVVDLDVTVDAGPDTLDETVDYRAIADVARDVVERRSFELLETLAREVARAVFGLEGVEAVVAVVHKPRAAGSLGADDVFVEAVLT